MKIKKLIYLVLKSEDSGKIDNMFPSVKLYSDGSGELCDGNDVCLFGFENESEILEKFNEFLNKHE